MSVVMLVKKAGQDVPQDVVAKLYDRMPGYVSIVGSDGKTVQVLSSEKKMPVEGLTGLINKRKNMRLLVVFGDDPKHKQPYTIVSDTDDKPMVVAVLDGNFSQFTQDGSQFPDEHLCVQRELIPRMKKLYGYTNGDLTKIHAELQDDMWANDIANIMVGDRGTVALVMGNGEIEVFTVNGDETAQNYDWGYVSNTFEAITSESEEDTDTLDSLEAEFANLGGESGAIPPVKQDKPTTTSVPVTTKGPSFKGPKHRPIASTEPINSPSVSPAGKPEQPGNPVETPQATPTSSPGTTEPATNPDLAAAAIADNEQKTINIPPGMSPKVRAKFIRRRYANEEVPQGANLQNTITQVWGQSTKYFKETWFEQNGITGLDVLANGKGTTAHAPQPTGKVNGNGQVVAHKPAEASSGQSFKGPKNRQQQTQQKISEYPEKQVSADVKPAAATPAKPDTGPAVTAEVLPILSPNQRKSIIGELVKPETVALIDRHSKLINDPKEFAKIEERIPTYLNQLGIDTIDEIFNWSPEVLKKLDHVAMDNSWTLAFWTIYECKKLKMENAELHAMLDKATTPKQEEPAPQQLKATGTDRATPAPSAAPFHKGPKNRAQRVAM